MNETSTLLNIKETTISTKLTVGTITLFDLFKNKLSIPDFQRPYEWNKRLVLKLFQDIEDHFYFEKQLKDNIGDFYLGSVLLNKKDDEIFEIIDGQQRLTTFLILDYLIDSEKGLLQKDSFVFHSNISVKNIVAIKEVIKIHKGRFEFTRKSIYEDVIKKIRLNVIITSDEQKAFQFFDSLNSKGKKLETVNILKSYHLRELKDENELQKKMAANFDSLNAIVEGKKFKDHRIYSLDSFVSLLWVKHNYWTKNNFSSIRKDTIELHLRDHSKRLIDNVKAIKLFPSIRNMRNTEIIIEEDKSTYNSTYEETDGINKVVEFNPMLPVQKGLGFFLSLEKLQHYFNVLFVNSELEILNKITALVKTSFNDYFLHLYYLVVLAYYVKFEDYRLEEFAFETEQIIGNKFLKLQSVRRESPGKIMRDEFNILQHIYLNVEPQYLFEELIQFKMTVKVRNIEREEKINEDEKFKKITRVDGTKYLSHTSRPTYIKRAKALYLPDENSNLNYTNINWKDYKSKK